MTIPSPSFPVLPNLSATRRPTYRVSVGQHAPVVIGDNAPIVVQSMTNTHTADVPATVAQIKALADAGSELVRITINTPEAARAVPEIRDQLRRDGYQTPVIGDFHYNGHKLLSDEPACAEAIDKLRINPGNVGQGDRHNDHFAQLINIALRWNKPIRIGVNWGSLDQAVLARLLDANQKRTAPLPLSAIQHDALVTSALESAALAESLGLPADRIVLSCKVSEVQDLIAVYQLLAQRCTEQQRPYPLHLGLTEAGIGSKGIVASTAALAILLQQGIGDTIRVSLTPAPGTPRSEEVVVAQNILQTLGQRAFVPMVTSCPGCGRTTSTVFQQLAAQIQDYVRQQMPAWRLRHHGVEHLKIAVMGCVVNGPGESKMANLGISLPGTGEAPVAPVYIDGQKTVTLRGANLAAQFQNIIDDYIQSHYPSSPTHSN